MKPVLFKRILYIALLLLAGSAMQAQGVKIGSNAQNVNPDAIFELESTTKGMIFPRVDLQGTTMPAPMSSFVKGMMVYNNATQNDVTPGMYFCDGTKWNKIVAGSFAGAPTANWGVNGNNSTNPSIHFLGTTDSVDFRIRTNNIERVSVTANGNVGIGTNSPAAKLEVNGDLKINSLPAGNLSTDKILVAQSDGKVRAVTASGLSTGVQRKIEVVAQSGQTIFTTPAPVTDINKIMMYRNGVLITCTQNNGTSVLSEVPCMTGDEIRIIQLL